MRPLASCVLLLALCSCIDGETAHEPYTTAQESYTRTNLLFGLVAVFGPRPLTLYKEHANRLQLAGL